jgi:chromosomal replication initiation ATPase DnaA
MNTTPTTEPITCPCGQTFDREIHDDEWMQRLVRKQTLCPACQEAADLEHDRRIEEDERRRERENMEAAKSWTIAQVREATPARYLATDLSHPGFNRAVWNRLKDWQPTPETPWLGMVGETGSSKTRIAYLIAARYLESITSAGNAPTFVFTTAYDIALAVTEQYGTRQFTTRSLDDGTPADAARAMLRTIRTADLVLIDDLGKCRFSPAVATEFFAVVDHRHAHALPMIWTANSTPQEIAAGLPSDMAGPFAGRLVECSRLIQIK